MAAFQWTKRREQAALLVAEDALSNEQIAAAVGIKRQSLDKWKRHREFRARVEENVAALRAAILAHGIAVKAERVKLLQDQVDRLQTVITERAADPTMAGVPGGKTGLLVRQAKLVKVYNNGGEPAASEDGETLYSAKRDVLVYDYAVDTATTKELREALKQVAIEVGEWTEKQQHDLTENFVQALKEFGRAVSA